MITIPFQQLGSLNFSVLARYRVRAQDMLLWDNFLNSNNALQALANHSPGIVYGGAITVVSGLTIAIAPFLALYPNGALVSSNGGQLTLTSADPTNPRLDRIEIALTPVNDQTVNNIDGNPVVLDIFNNGIFTINKGTAAGSPVAPTLTAGSFSLGIIALAATQTLLQQANIDQGEISCDLAKDVSRMQRIALIANNQASPVNVPNLSFNSLKTKSAKIFCQIYRTDSLTERLAVGDIFVRFFPVANTWEINSDEFDDAGVVFSISSTGQLQYTSDNCTGSGYVGQMDYTVDYLTT